jgi:hypothetical protein
MLNHRALQAGSLCRLLPRATRMTEFVAGL